MAAYELNYLLSVLTIAGQISALWLLGYLLWCEHTRCQPHRGLVRLALPAAWGVALLGTIASLYYSEVLGFPPCNLCWYQRIFMYPQVFMLGFAWYRHDRSVVPYSLLLSGIGIALAGYHSYLQFGGSPLIPCGAGSQAAACAQRFVFEFGFITIPLMTATAFALMLLCMGILVLDKKAIK